MTPGPHALRPRRRLSEAVERSSCGLYRATTSVSQVQPATVIASTVSSVGFQLAARTPDMNVMVVAYVELAVFWIAMPETLDRSIGPGAKAKPVPLPSEAYAKRQLIGRMAPMGQDRA